MPHSDQSFVWLRDVEKSYDGIELIVKRLSLEIGKGEFVTMLGPSGSGKTTTLMMLAGFEAPTAGTISVAGKDLTYLPPHKRGIGMVFQDYALFPHMTVAENIAFPLIARRCPKAEIRDRVAGALRRVKLDPFGHRRPGQLSGGQKQRVALARALVFEPALVLMDEPLGALDKQLRDHMQVEIKRLHGELGLTIVYVTHDQDEALAMSDRIVVFNRGGVEQIGTCREIYEAPKTAFVAEFVGENNWIRGRVRGQAGPGRFLVDVPGGDLVGTAGDELSVGAEVLLAIRPERIMLEPGSGSADSGSADVVAQAEITDIVYLGDHVRMRCRILGDVELMVKQANGPQIAQRQPGDRVRIGWRTADCRVLPVS